ncbi:unnamed protein product, partial [Ixodes pacificus]
PPLTSSRRPLDAGPLASWLSLASSAFVLGDVLCRAFCLPRYRPQSVCVPSDGRVWRRRRAVLPARCQRSYGLRDSRCCLFLVLKERDGEKVFPLASSTAPEEFESSTRTPCCACVCVCVLVGFAFWITAPD